LNQLDGVIVPCIWNAEVFRNSGVHVPIHVAAHLSQFDDATLISDSDRLGLQQRLGEPRLWQDRFCFYNIGFWSNRKAPYLVLEAYLQAFTVADPVCLIIKTCAKDITLWHRHWRNLFRRRHPSPSLSSTRLANKFPAPPPFVIICDESLSDGELQALHELGDCFVSLTRTEGWGLGAFEAARLGKPVVMTGYGGQLEYLAPELCWLVDYEMVQVIEPTWGANYREDDQWAEPSIAQAAVHMREIFTDSQAAAARGEKLAEKIGKDFSRSATIQALLAALA
jgi:glycosyltransferase involved in cell wall biosynthesis